ncbi:MAG: methyltransferase domain-containing protein [Pyrinomonadaceae bacterium]|nr:methyltransferase domain-containing protein [Pyrinomonadaceae bacterium]
MTDIAYTKQFGVEQRARQSLGTSDAAIYKMVAGALEGRSTGGLLVDVGCGNGQLWPFVSQRFSRYIGVDVVRYEDFPADAEFKQVDLDTGQTSLPDDSADVVASVETIEHLENPRAFMRELARITKPGGWIIVTTPNQLSLLSLITLLFKKQFSAFQDVHYPAHLTALLEIDLKRIAEECGLHKVSVLYSHQGRIILTPYHYPASLSRLFPRALSDNVLLIGRKLSQVE